METVTDYELQCGYMKSDLVCVLQADTGLKIQKKRVRTGDAGLELRHRHVENKG